MVQTWVVLQMAPLKSLRTLWVTTRSEEERTYGLVVLPATQQSSRGRQLTAAASILGSALPLHALQAQPELFSVVGFFQLETL